MTSEQFVTRMAVSFFSIMCAILIVVIFVLRHRAMRDGQDKRPGSIKK